MLAPALADVLLPRPERLAVRDEDVKIWPRGLHGAGLTR